MRSVWIAVLCGYLLLWVPLNFAALASLALPSIEHRGFAAVGELAAHAVGAMLSAAAGWMLWVRNPAARRLAAVALVCNAVLRAQALYASALPRDISPGLALPLGIVTVVHAGAWILYVSRSRRLREWLREP